MTQAMHWCEGMFIRPHHFQLSQRYLLDQIRRSHQWDLHYGWGVRSVDIDLDALGNHKVVIRRLEARLRDGTIVSVPEDCKLADAHIQGALQQTNPLMVFLAVPTLYLGRRNAVQAQSGAERFLIESHEFSDENTGGNRQAISVRRLNVKLLVGDQEQAGFETLPLARIKKSDRAEATPELDSSFVPPLLSCDAWPALQEALLQAVFERISKKLDWLVKFISKQGISFDRQAQGDDVLLNQLRKLNEAYGVLRVLLYSQGLHPLQAFLELSRVIGQLAIFGKARRIPDLPHYDHDNLHHSFAVLKECLDELLDVFVEPAFRERPLKGAGLRMQVALDPNWLESAWQLFIGVRSSLSSDDCIQLLTRPGELDMKIGSSDRVESIFREGHQGLRFEHQRRPPQALPEGTGWIFFEIKHSPGDTEWHHVQKSLHLAVRINERLITSAIQDQRILTIKAKNKSATMEFTLFAIQQDRS